MSTNVDHFTPLSRAVAAIGRDAYAERFAVYDREYKAMLRRVATVQPPLSAADLTREEKAFHEAVRRVEFGAEDAPTLVPQDEPVAEASPARLRELVADARTDVWPRPRPPRQDPAEETTEQDGSELDAVMPVEARPGRSLKRRVGERMGLAVLLLLFLTVMNWMGPKPQANSAAADLSATSADSDPQRFGAGNNAFAGLSRQPPSQWIAPQVFSAAPPLHPLPPAMPAPVAVPQAAAPQTAASLPHLPVPLPVPRPDI